MLMSFNTKVFSIQKVDKRAAQTVRDAHGITDEKAVRASKRIIEEADSYKAITKVIADGRDAFHKETLPWLWNSVGVLSNENFMHTTELFNDLQGQFYRVVPPFVDEFELLAARAKKVIPGLWNAKDYPTKEKLKKRFSFSFDIFPMPSEADFRADIPAEQFEIVKVQMAASIEAAIQQSMVEPYNQLWDAVAHMASRLQAETTCPCRNCKGKTFQGEKFGDSLVDNLREVCERLPRLNITADPKLAGLIEETRLALTPFDAEVLRESDRVKESLAERAMAIRDQMSMIMAA